MRAALAATTAAGVLLGSSGCGPFGSDTISISARFTESVGLFPGNRVDVLGVPIGRVTKVTPEGTSVLVRMSVPADFKIPANAGALIIPPSVITDRYLELTPAWTGGPTITAGAEIPLARTRTPVEFDRIVRALDSLSNSLNGDQQTVAAIRDALHVGAANLKGNGTAIHNSIEGLSAALGTLADNSANISGLIHSLDGLTAAFAQNDATVRQFSKNVTAATALLADNSKSLTETVGALSTALKEVSSFVKDNQTALGTGLNDLSNVLAAINAHKGALTEALDVLPLTFQNLAMAINPANHRMRANASAAANILNPVVLQQFCDGFGPFLCANAGKPIGSLSDVFGARWQR
ncbi:MAG TPA: MCE family protein [Sporichthyaceae bacterium]|jgi:virulence factor Mce-like protein|nr:MCE family protein [Sporichthyaceae bacterium]